MTRNFKLFSIGLAACSVASAIVVQANASDMDQPGTRKVSIAFAAKVGAKPFACGEVYEGLGLGQTSVKGSDMRFYVSDVELTTADGQAIPVQLDQDGLWQYKNLAMLDFEDGTSSCSNGNAGMHKQVTGTVPAGSYTGLRFTVGVPFELDHIDAASAPSPLNMTAMFWSWQGGYKFVKAEILLVKPLPVVAAADPPETGMSVPAAHEEALTQAEGHAPGSSVPGKMLATGMKPRVRSNGFPVHLGSTGCASASPTKAPVRDCVHPNRPVIVFDTFDVANNTVVFDMAQLLKNVDLSVAPPKGSGPGCMSFPEMAMCKKVMPAFGLPSGDVTEVVQTVFSREAKQ